MPEETVYDKTFPEKTRKHTNTIKLLCEACELARAIKHRFYGVRSLDLNSHGQIIAFIPSEPIVLQIEQEFDCVCLAMSSRKLTFH